MKMLRAVATVNIVEIWVWQIEMGHSILTQRASCPVNVSYKTELIA